MYKRVVLPLDGSDLAELAIPHAVQLARLTGADLHLVRVIDILGGQAFGAYVAIEAAGYAEATGAELAESAGYLEEIQRRLADRGFRVTTELRRGPAAHEVTQCADAGDVIVMATHGRGGVRRWLLGSVAEEVVRHAPVPVLLVRGDQEAPAETRDLEALGEVTTLRV